jgi:hypothetical protein
MNDNYRFSGALLSEKKADIILIKSLNPLIWLHTLDSWGKNCYIINIKITHAD